MTRSHRGGDDHRATPGARHAYSPDDTDTGDDGAGYGEAGYGGAGYGGAGHGRAGYARSGYEGSGRDGTGYHNTGYDNTGYDDTAYHNTGYDDTGYVRTGYVGSTRRYRSSHAGQGQDASGRWHDDTDIDVLAPRSGLRRGDPGSPRDVGLTGRAASTRPGGHGGGRRGDEIDPDGRRAGGKGGRRRRRWRRVLAAALVTSSVLLLAGVATFVILYVRTPIPDPNAELNANKTTLYYQDGSTVLGGFAVQNRVSVPLDQVPRHVQDAVIAAENRTFWTDSGISPTGIIRAAWNQLRGGSKQSGSTITQQYVKNYYLTQEQTWSRKIKELFITLKIQRQL